MTLIEPEAARPPHTAWDALVAVCLGAALLAVGVLDVRSFLVHHRDENPSGFSFLVPTGTEQNGDHERYRQGETMVWLENIGSLEEIPHSRFRHAFGPQCGLAVYTQGTRARMFFKLYNPIAGQDFTLRCNGEVTEQFHAQPEGVIERSYSLPMHPGNNEITLTFARYNHGGADFAADDPRPIAGTFHVLDLTLD